MTETDIATMTFELLKRMQGQMSRIEADIGDLKVRTTAIETRLGQITAHMGQQDVQIAGLGGRMDRFDERLGRIERRLELIDA